MSRWSLVSKFGDWRTRLIALGAVTSLVTLYVLRDVGSSTKTWTIPFTHQTLHWENHAVFLLLALLPTLLIGTAVSLSGLSWAQRLTSFFLRAAFFAALVLSLGRPEREIASHKICEVALVDVSRSVSDADLQRAIEQLALLEKKHEPSDRFHLLTFAERPRHQSLQFDDKGVWLPPSVQDLRRGHPGEGTNLELAFEQALSYVGSDCHNRYVVFSDGIETRGSALSVVADLVKRNINVATSVFEAGSAEDVAVTFMETEGEVRVGEPFRLRVELSATRPASGQLRLFQNDTLNGLDGVKLVELPQGKTLVTFETVVRVGGDVNYRVEYVPRSSDEFSANNTFVLSMDVPGPPRVLVIDRRPGQIAYFVNALAAQQFDVDVRGPDAFPRSLDELEQFDFVVLSDVSRDDVSRGGEALVERYVRVGGGLLFAGGEAGFGPGGWQGSRLEKILPVVMDAEKEREIPGVAMSLVIDRSGSMTGLPLAMAKEACIATLGVLSPNDLIEVIAFDSRPTSYVPLQPARYRLRIEEAVSRIVPGGGTEIFNSLDRAYQSLSAVEARRKHIILLTDGNASSDGIYELVSTAFAEGITVTTVGLGNATNQALLTMIAETGGGRFIEADDPSRLPRIFTRETELISKKPTLEDWFPVSVEKNAEFLQGINLSGAPFLRGYTPTRMAQAPAEAILVSDRGEPILARRPVGLGWTLAWTSDLKARWAVDFLRFRQFGQLMAQLIRKHQRVDHTEVRPMQVRLEGDEVVAQIDAFDSLDHFENNLRSTLEVRRPWSKPAASGQSDSGEGRAAFAALAPGLYEARYRLPAPGAYALKAVHHRALPDGRTVPAGVSYGSVSWPYPEEYRDLSPRRAFMHQLSTLTHGAIVQDGAFPKASESNRVISRQRRQAPFIVAAIVLFFLDLFVRRVRLFDRRFSARQPVWTNADEIR